jgi:hypothetical protein
LPLCVPAVTMQEFPSLSCGAVAFCFIVQPESSIK